jgi:hypothetical protein
MPTSTISVFSEPEDFRAAMRANGVVTLVVSDGAEYWARLARISLNRMRLFAGEEQASRVASMFISPGFVRVSLPAEPAASLTWDGIRARRNEITTHSARHRFNEQTDGACRWSTIWLRAADLAKSVRATTGSPFVVPPGERRWQPKPDALRLLVGLHGNSLRATAVRGKLPIEKEAARGLEQQLLHALAECLVDGSPTTGVLPNAGTSPP